MTQKYCYDVTDVVVVVVVVVFARLTKAIIVLSHTRLPLCHCRSCHNVHNKLVMLFWDFETQSHTLNY